MTSVIPDSMTSVIPDSMTSVIPDSMTSVIPDSMTSVIPDSMTNVIPEAHTKLPSEGTSDGLPCEGEREGYAATAATTATTATAEPMAVEWMAAESTPTEKVAQRAAGCGSAAAVGRWANGWAKPLGLVATPELISEPLRADDEFLILGTDGLWNLLSATEAVRAARTELRAYEDAQMAAEKLVEMAVSRHADDNVTCIVVRLFAPRPEEAVARSFARPGQKLVAMHSANPNAFLHLPTAGSFVRVVGGFGAG